MQHAYGTGSSRINKVSLLQPRRLVIHSIPGTSPQNTVSKHRLRRRHPIYLVLPESGRPVHQPSPHPDSNRVPIISGINPLLNLLWPRLPAKHIDRPSFKVTVVRAPSLHTPKINDLRIKLLADVKPANFIGETNDCCAAAGREVQRFFGREFGFVAQCRLEG